MSELLRYCAVERISSLILAKTIEMEIEYFSVCLKEKVQLIQDTYGKLIKFTKNS